MIEAELFDGTVLEFPPGTSPDVVQRVAREQTAARRASAPAAQGATAPAQTSNAPAPGQGGFSPAPGQTPGAPPERSWMDAITSGTVQGIAGVREGVSNLLGLPVDIINNAPRVANLLPGVDGVGPISQNPVGGSDWLERNVFRAGGAVPEAPAPAGAGERVIRRVGQEVGAAALPVGGAIATGARVGVEGARQMNPIARMFVEPAAIAPGRFAQKETAVALGAGAGASAANEMTNNINPQTGVYNPSTADFLGALGGAAGMGIAGQIAKPIGTATSALFNRPQLIEDVVKEATVEEIIRAAGLRSAPGEVVDTTQFARQIEQGRRVGETVPGFKESLADRTKNPGLAALEYGRQSGPNSGMFVGARDTNTRAVNDALTATKPEGTPEATRQAVVAERDRRLVDAANARMEAETAASQAVAPLAPQSTPAQRGSVIRNELETARDAARARTEDAYQQANIAGKQVDPAPLTQSLDEAVGGLTVTERGLVPQGMIDAVSALGRETEAGPAGAIRLKEAADLRSELGRLQAAAAADPNAERGGRNAARVLGQMAERVDGFIMSNLTPDEQAALAAARGARTSEADAFGRQGDPIAEVLARREGGVYRTRDDLVGSRLVNPQAMDRLFAEADTPATRRAIRDEVLAKGDASSPERIDRFMQDYGQQIDKLPGLRDELTQAANARRSEARVRTDEQTLRRDLGTDTEPGRSVVGRFARYDASRADDALQEVLRDPQPAKAADDLLNFVGNKPEAVAGVRRVFWERMEGKARASGATTASTDGVQPWSPTRLKEFLDDPVNGAVAERLYRDNPEHLARIREIADAVQGTNTKTAARASNSSGTAQALNESNLPSAETIASRAFAVQRGQVGIPFTALNIAGIMARKATKRGQMTAINSLLDKALLDPDVAAALVKEYNPANRAAMARKAKAWVGNQASTLIEMLDDDPDAEMKNAVTGGQNGNR